MFSTEILDVVRFCSIECELQRSGEKSVWWMINAWNYAVKWATSYGNQPTVDDIIRLGREVDPGRNVRGFRQVPVQVGSGLIGWENIPDQIMKLCSDDVFEGLTPEEWFYRYEEVHPFEDGNGRTGQILYNWLRGSLKEPVWAPDFWSSPRRRNGYGSSGM